MSYLEYVAAPARIFGAIVFAALTILSALTAGSFAAKSKLAQAARDAESLKEKSAAFGIMSVLFALISVAFGAWK